MSLSKAQRKRVLVADDDDSIRQLLCTLVRREKIEVDAASDGLQAVALLEQNRYDVILLDLMMPRLDGFGVVEFLKSHPTDPKPVVLVITAYADQRFKEVDPEIVTGVIRKPFEVSEIGTLIRLCTSADSPAQALRRNASHRAIREFIPLSRRGVSGKGDDDVM